MRWGCLWFRCLSLKICQLAVCCHNPLLFLARSSTIRKDLGTSTLLSQLLCLSLAPPEEKPGSRPSKQKKETWHLQVKNWMAEQTRGDGMIVAMQKDAPLLSSSQPISPHLFLFIYLFIFYTKCFTTQFFLPAFFTNCSLYLSFLFIF